ncbi:hypothetical protein G6F37_000107 [Rhizopus arrhizus]|nr:hypothetical protein G6F38_002168 [Rhizopus arrhizus]KAG1164641.1 hypothetical protein G6F37_000107 [Rhizopus arrhizus]
MFASSINCLLYADDVVLITSPSRLQTLLQQCEEHSYQLGYRWNPLKCAIVAPVEDTQSYSLYNTAIPRQDSFPYLSIPIRPGGYINTSELIQGNINKALKTMNQMTAIGVNSTGFDRLLSARFYYQIVRPQLEYGLVISACLRRIFGGSPRSSVKVMLHLINQPTMKERIHILQTKFLLRSLDVPDDTLLFQLLPYIRISARGSQWYKLTTSPLWRLCTVQDVEQIDKRRFRAIRQEYLQKSLEQRCDNTNSVLLSACRVDLKVDPILWLLMTPVERSCLLRWRLGWLPGGLPRPCIYHPFDLLTRTHAIECLHMHRRLQMPRYIPDSLSFLLNKLPTSRKKPTDKNRSKHITWSIRWLIICQILHELDYLHYDQISSDVPLLVKNYYLGYSLALKCIDCTFLSSSLLYPFYLFGYQKGF